MKTLLSEKRTQIYFPIELYRKIIKMTKVFIDTSALVALFDRSDNNHQKAKTLLEIIRNNKRKLLMSDYIFDETITTVLSNAGHKTAIEIGEFILGSNICHFFLHIYLPMFRLLQQ